VLLLAGSAAQAQDLQYSSQASHVCVAQAATPSGKRACVGVSANACMNATSDGGTTVGMGYCLDEERKYWDARLNSAYRVIRAKAQTLDVDMLKIGATAPRTSPALRDMQRTWIVHRDATCNFEMVQWGGGTGGGPANLGCLMRMTGEQALYLEQVWFGE
jgi:uncharacterized protein YecT (DUF1311 family)